VRRGVAGVLFFVAAVCLAIAAAGWWLQQVAFDMSKSAELAEVVLQDPEIRAEIADVSANAAAATLGLPPEEVRARVELVAQTEEGSDLMRQIIADSHARLIGARPDEVQITGQQLVDIVRDERAAALPNVVLPVPEVAALRIADTTLDWAVPIAAIAGGVALLLGFLAHPRKADAVFGIGTFCIAAAIAVVIIGWLIPVYAVPEINDSPWISVIPAVAQHNLPFVLIIAAALFIGGLGLMLSAEAARRRRLWSAPISVHRYGDQRHWS
jgi:hypothetical protein